MVLYIISTFDSGHAFSYSDLLRVSKDKWLPQKINALFLLIVMVTQLRLRPQQILSTPHRTYGHHVLFVGGVARMSGTF